MCLFLASGLILLVLTGCRVLSWVVYWVLYRVGAVVVRSLLEELAAGCMMRPVLAKRWRRQERLAV